MMISLTLSDFNRLPMFCLCFGRPYTSCLRKNAFSFVITLANVDNLCNSNITITQCQKNFADCVTVKFEFFSRDLCCFTSTAMMSPLHRIIKWFFYKNNKNKWLTSFVGHGVYRNLSGSSWHLICVHELVINSAEVTTNEQQQSFCKYILKLVLFMSTTSQVETTC